jgi:elongation factor G
MEENFKGVIDLIAMQAVCYRDDLGNTIDVGRIPEDLRGGGREAPRHHGRGRRRESDDELTHKFLEGEEPSTEEEIRHGLRPGPPSSTRSCPILTGSALKNKGIQPMLDAVVDFLPSPLDVPPVIGEDPRTHVRSPPHRERQGTVQRARVQDRGRPVRRQARVLPRVLGDPQVGLLRYNATKDRKERIGRILQMHANHREEIEEVYAGDIAAAVGLKESFTGDTLTDPSIRSSSNR